MRERKVSADDIRHVIETGEVIEDYPNDRPFPSRLFFGSVGGRALHVVAADNAQGDETLVVTVYEPDLLRWEPGFRRRRSQP
jgi:hypothetical protein